jgi:hypothetical protein
VVAVGFIGDTEVVGPLRLVIRVVWRWETALRGRRAAVPQRESQAAVIVAWLPRSAAERRRLVRGLSDRCDWAGLLRLAMGLPVRDAVVIRRWFSPWWRPTDERDRRVYSALAQVRVSKLVGAYGVLRQAGFRTVQIGGRSVCWEVAYVRAYRPYLEEVPTPFSSLCHLVDKPQAYWTLEDLGYVRALRSLAQENAGLLPLYDVVAECMEWRFAT